jgi:hypothetical protein
MFLRDLWEERETEMVLDMVKSGCEVRAGRPPFVGSDSAATTATGTLEARCRSPALLRVFLVLLLEPVRTGLRRGGVHEQEQPYPTREKRSAETRSRWTQLRALSSCLIHSGVLNNQTMMHRL